MKTIFLNASGAGGFKNWSIAHPPSCNDDDDDHPGGATPIALAVPVVDELIMVPPEHPHRPWLVPGRGAL